MEPEEFAAKRRVIFDRADKELAESVREALVRYKNGQVSWDVELVDDASVIWLEVFESEAPNADPDRFLPRFREALGEALSKTDQPQGPAVEQSQIERVTRWLGTYVVNDATWHGTSARGTRAKRWTTMHDRAVRESHAVVDGQVRPIRAPFSVGGYDLRFPGDPVGPPEIWINCRCIIQPADRRGALNVSTTTFAVDEDVDLGEDLPVDELEDDEEEVTEIPVHGVLAPEGVRTGDGRQFGEGALTSRDLPLPIAYQLLSGDGHAGSATVGRIDEVFREGNEFRFRGALMLNREYTSEVIDGIIDGTVRGISVDVDNVIVGEMSEEDGHEFVTFSEARVAGVTIVPIPAFQEAFISLGHDWVEMGEMSPEDALAACGCKGPEEDEDNPDIELAYDAFKQYDAEARKRMAANGQALPDGSFPIADVEDLKNAIQAIGRASDPSAARAHIKKRARALGEIALIPEGWAVEIVDLSVLTDEELAAYEATPPTEQDEWLETLHPDAILASAMGFAPGTKDGPGWITHPVATARIRRYWVHGKGAAKIRWGLGAPGGDFNRCRRQLAKYVQNPKWLAGLCANMHKEATGFWPGSRVNRGKALRASAGMEAAPIFTLVASANYVFDSNLFKKPQMETPRVGVEVEDDRVYGYIAQWGVCHIGITGVCTKAPPSFTDYWYYATGKVDTDEGTVRVGQITMDTGHAPLKANARIAAAHYDNTGAAAADVAVGEDEFGIWFSGVLRSKVSDEMRHALRASGRVSGDWREIQGNLELVAALAVNVPGFPIPHARAGVYDGVQVSLVAAGLLEDDEPLTEEVMSFSAAQVAGIVRTSVQEYRHQEKVAAKAAPIREALRQKKIESIRAKIKE